MVNWRIWLGLGLTTAWLLLGALYITFNMGWSAFVAQPPDDMGNFLEGAFAPLAFLWLVIGYFLQKKELEQNTEALRAQAIEIQRSAEQAVIQSDNLAASERHQRQEAFLKIADSVSRQLGSIAGLLFISSQSDHADDEIDPRTVSELFSNSSSDPEAFSRRMLQANLNVEPENQLNLFYGTDIRARHTNNFIFTYERMMRRAAEADTDAIIQDALSASGHGFLYRIMKRHQANAPDKWSDHTKTGTHINF